MTRFRQIYLFAVLGVFGGLIAAILHQLLLLEPLLRTVGTPSMWLWNLVLGICIGAPIAFAPRLATSLGYRPWPEALREGLIGAAGGAIGGMAAVLLGEWLHHALGGGYPGRICATMLLGIAIGGTEILFNGTRKWRALAGGAIGGALAGLLVELLVSRPQPAADSAILALLLLGLSIPLAIAISVHIRPEAWLEGIEGAKIARQIFHLGKFAENDVAVIGSADKCFIYMRAAEPEHATLFIAGDGTRLRATARTSETLVNGNPVRECILRNGDQIEIAGSTLIYKERAKSRHPAPQPRVRFVGKGAAMIITLLAAVSTTRADDQYKAAVTDIVENAGNQISGHVLITDGNGHPLRDSDRVNLLLFENDIKVAERTISEGRKSSSVLVLDRSGSMKGAKIASAREAAAEYVRLAPPFHQIMLLVFDARPTIQCAFTSDKAALLRCVDQIQTTPRGTTALLDATITALNEVSTREGTRSVLVMTDGIDNRSGAKAAAVIAAAQSARAAVSVIGLGRDVKEQPLRSIVFGGGRYLVAGSSTDLQPLFQSEARLLSARYFFSYISTRPSEGSRRKVTARAEIVRPDSRKVVAEDQRTYVARHFIPGLRGNLRPYLASVGGLLIFPFVLTLASGFLAIRSFRARQVVPVHEGSGLIGIRDANSYVLEAGDIAVECPSCRRAHHIRSWRNNRCRCMREPNGKGYVCYQRMLPAPIRKWLDSLSGEHTTASGRRWLCRCSGDPDGY